VRQGELLRQLHGGDVLQDAEVRARVAHRLRNAPGGRTGHRPLYRRVLQPRQAPLRPRLHKPEPVRKIGGRL
ncbi:MAG: Mobile element protein, partial [uncultured Acetobacteraceae bacterium]